MERGSIGRSGPFPQLYVIYSSPESEKGPRLKKSCECPLARNETRKRFGRRILLVCKAFVGDIAERAKKESSG